LGSIIKEIIAAGEALVEFGHAPWCNDLDGRLEGVECKFETDLVVTLASATMGDSNATFLLGDGDLSAGDDWASERCS
jgi:hypothetical protein